MSSGAPDSRSETLSPREWPTLEAARRLINEAEESLGGGQFSLGWEQIIAAQKVLGTLLPPLARTVKLTDAGVEPCSKRARGRIENRIFQSGTKQE